MSELVNNTTNQCFQPGDTVILPCGWITNVVQVYYVSCLCTNRIGKLQAFKRDELVPAPGAQLSSDYQAKLF